MQFAVCWQAPGKSHFFALSEPAKTYQMKEKQAAQTAGDK